MVIVGIKNLCESIESGRHTQIKLLIIFYEIIQDKAKLGILVFNNIV